MKFGALIPSWGGFATVTAIREVALAAERLGFDSVWVGDHINYDLDWAHYNSSGHQGEEPNLNVYEAHTVLTYIAGLTKRVSIGTSIVVLALRDPRVFAKEAMTLQALSDGRLIIGVGLGDYLGDFDLVEKSKSDRVSLTEEYLEVLNTLFKGGDVTYDGKTIKVNRAVFYPKVPKIPLLYGGGVKMGFDDDGEFEMSLSKKSIERAARLCDGLIPLGPPDIVGEGIKMMQDIAPSFGRKPDSDNFAMIFTYIAETDEEAQEGIRPSLERAPFPFDKLGAAAVGSPETVIKRIKAFQDVGITHVNLMFRAETLQHQLKMMEMVTEKVMPHFRT